MKQASPDMMPDLSPDSAGSSARPSGAAGDGGADARGSVRASVVGATGYAGGELIRWLLGHPKTRLVHLVSRRWADRPVAEAWPALRGLGQRRFVEVEPELLVRDSDVVFLAVPHGTAMPLAAALLGGGVRVVDLSADFRLRDPDEYSRWYGAEHEATGLLGEAVYGLPELHRGQVAGARLVANPGCYPTAVLLALLPLVQDGLVDGPLAVDAKSGVSGAGRAPSARTSFVEVNENLRPYGVGDHRHTPEMEQALAGLGFEGGVFFTPHLVPLSRGLLASCHFRLARSTTQEEVMTSYAAAYDGEPFVRVLTENLPDTRSTLGSNFCDVTVRVDAGKGVGVAFAAIDNLGKGAASQAVQNFNLMFAFDEKEGLWTAPTFP